MKLESLQRDQREKDLMKKRGEREGAIRMQKSMKLQLGIINKAIKKFQLQISWQLNATVTYVVYVHNPK